MSGGGPARPGGISARSVGKYALQGLGFAVGVGLLVWCVQRAFSNPEQRAQLSRLLEAAWWQVGALLAMSAGTIALDGLMFRAVLSPVQRISRWRMVGVSGVCSALSYLPFKMSLIFRLVFHSRRDGLSLLTIGAWVAASGAVLLCGQAPPLLALLVRPGLDGAWWVLAIGGSVASMAAVHLAARGLSGEEGVRRIAALADWTRIGVLGRLARGAAFGKMHAGVVMLADPRGCWAGFAYRAGIVALQGGRVYLASRVIGVEVSGAQAVLVGASYTLIQAISPAGVGGLREAGAAGLGQLMGGPSILSVVLAVTATEAVVNLVMGAGGAAGLRVDRLLGNGETKRRRDEETK